MNRWLQNAMIATTALTSTFSAASEMPSYEGVDLDDRVLELSHEQLEGLELTMDQGARKLKDRMRVIETMQMGGSKLKDRMIVAETMLMGGSKLKDRRIIADQIGEMTTLEEKSIIVERLFKGSEGADNTEVIEELRKVIDRLSN